MDSTTIAGRLPFDVLGSLFDRYLDGETIEYPLETLLLVCRSWNEAALGHRNLWGRLRIHVSHFPKSNIWFTRLPRRLDRAGHSTPLEIDLRSILDSQYPPEGVDIESERCERRITNSSGHSLCSCIGLARAAAKDLLRILAGRGGVLCERWKSLYLCLGPYTDVGEEMTYPTPNLQVLCLERSSFERGANILPSLPNLRHLTIHRPFFFKLPDLHAVHVLELLDFRGWSPDLSNLETATSVEKLTIGMKVGGLNIPTPHSLPEHLPHLSSLSFIGNYLPRNFATVTMPNIRHLSLRLDDAATLQAVADSSIPFWDLEELELTWPYAHLGIYEELRIITSDLILSCINLSRIKGERKSLSVIVKLYWEECATRSTGLEYILGKTLVFWSNDVEREVRVARPERKEDLEGVALSLGLIPPSMSWGYMLARF